MRQVTSVERTEVGRNLLQIFNLYNVVLIFFTLLMTWAFQSSVLVRVMPRYLIDLEKGTGSFPTRMTDVFSGRMTLRYLALPIIIALVLALLSKRSFDSAQDLIDSISALMSLIHSFILFGGQWC
ncbi:unnamed protein product [Lasius platythorax]|uniref:Uncharacterized protein n=1 Tax=Lasius platythorax TaxID=488582 RepID=A0AAV2MZI9_9HYME